MLWKDLFHLLGNCPIKLFKQSIPELDIEIIQTLRKSSFSVEDNSLLLCRYSQLSGLQPEQRKQVCLFLLLDQEQIDATLWDDFCNVAAISDEELYNQYAEMIRSSNREHRRLEQAHSRLLELISDNQPLTTLANTVASIYDHYVDIIDNSLNILAISENIAPPAANLLEDHRNRYVKPHVVQYLRTTGNLEKMQASRLPVLVEDEPRNTYAYSVPITAGAGINLGFLCVFVAKGESLSPVQLYYLPRTARLLSLEMQKSRSNLLNKSTYFTHLLSDMLQGRAAVDSTFEARFASFSYDLRRWKNIIVLNISSALPSSTDLHILSQTLQSLFGNCVYMIQDNYIIFLVSRHHSPELPAEELTEWSAYARSNHLRIGISSTFENALSAAAHLEQAKTALTLGERFHPAECAYLYDRLRLLAIVDKLSAKGDLHLNCFPPLLRLIETDTAEESGTLVETLRSYMDHSYSAADTCKALFIHRNTLYYRLTKIRDIMGCDFAQPENAAQITLTFSILQYLGHI